MAVIGTVTCRSAPSIKKMATSAVASSTAIGVLDIAIPELFSMRKLQEHDLRPTSLSTGIDVDVIIICFIVADTLQRLWH